ncbi:MAG: hypothetical protein AAF716_09500 [Cyanobacteria bacterium P01_D01_bin.1]
MNHLYRARSRVHCSPNHSNLLRPIQSWLAVVFFFLSVRLSAIQSSRLSRAFNWKIIGVCLGVLLFCSITTHADPASAQLFNNVESQVKTIFGTNIDQSIISFLFGVLRIVIWVTSVGFILFAVYQAQRGEQWQPLMQNAFIVVAAVVVVEGMSKLFFGTTTGGT